MYEIACCAQMKPQMNLPAPSVRDWFTLPVHMVLRWQTSDGATTSNLGSTSAQYAQWGETMNW